MKTLIIEDEKPAARRLQRMLQKLELNTGHTLHSVEEAKEWFAENTQPDLVFLDIQLSDGLSFDIFETIELRSAVIFTTAYDEYALQAFRLNSIDYLLKPIDVVELEKAVNKYRALKQSLGAEGSFQNLNFDDIKKMLVNPLDREYKKRFSVQVGQHIKLIETGDIHCFYSRDKATYAQDSSGREHLLDTTLDKLTDSLDPAVFFRVNRKFIVNIHGLTDITTYSNTRLKLQLSSPTAEPIIVARERVRDFKEWLNE